MSHARTSIWFADYLLSLLVGAAVESLDVQPHLALLSAVDEADTFTEVTDETYQRSAVTLSIASGAVVRTTTNAAFPVATNSTPVVAVGLFSSATAGELLAIHPLDAPATIAPGQRLTIAAGDWSLRLAGAIPAALLDSLLNRTLHSSAWEAVSELYLALLTDYANDEDFNEQQGTGYARQAITLDAISAATASNLAAITFGGVAEGWLTVTHAALFDAATGGRLLARSELSQPLIPQAGRALRVPAGAVQLSLS